MKNTEKAYTSPSNALNHIESKNVAPKAATNDPNKIR